MAEDNGLEGSLVAVLQWLLSTNRVRDEQGTSGWVQSRICCTKCDAGKFLSSRSFYGYFIGVYKFLESKIIK